MTAADFDNKTKSLDNSSNNGYSNDSSSNGNNSNTGGGGTMTRMHPSMKRPRAPIACFRCHHKKVRCDGAHPNCTRCLSTGVLCAYPSSRRSRNTQPTNVDPFIDNLSHLEARIRRIENDLESQRNMMHSICKRNSPNKKSPTTAASDLASQMRKTEQEVQESRSILAQLRLRGEQRLARGKRAVSSTNAAAAVAAAVAGSGSSSVSSNLFNEHSHHHVAKRPCNRRTSEPDLRTLEQQQQQQHPAPIPTATAAVAANGASPFYYPAATDAVSFMYRPFDAADWSIFNNLPHTPVPDVSAAADANCTLMEYDSILTHPMDPVAKQDMQQRGIAPPLLTVAGDMPTPILRPSSSIDSSSSSSSSTQMPPNASDTFMPQIVLDELETNPDLQQALNNDSHSSVVTTAAASLTNTTITTATAAAADAITASITNTNPSTASTTTTPTVWYC